MNLRSAATLIGLGVLLSGCPSNNIFFDDFDEDTVGTRPDLSPAGPPAGDEIYLSNPPGQLPEPAVVVADPDFSGYALRYSNVDTELFYRYVGFISDTADPAADTYLAHFVGKLSDTSTMSALDVWFGNSHFGEIASLRFDNGHAYVKTSSVGPTWEDLGALVPGEVHTVWFNVSKTNKTYTASIFQQGNTLTSGTRPVLDADLLSTTRPSLYLWYSEDISSSGSYTVDEVTITEVFDEDLVSEALPDLGGLSR